MCRQIGVLVTVALSSSCATYTAYSRSYGDGPNGETMGILVGAEAAAGVATAIGISIHSRRVRVWYENAAIGFLAPFILDVAFALGVSTTDFVGE